MRAIPKKLLNDMLSDPFYRRCCITGSTYEKIDLHHNLIFAGRQVNEKWAILPLAKSVHDNIVANKEKCDWIMLNRASDSELRPYCKTVDYFRLKERLNKKYGVWEYQQSSVT